VGQKETAMNSAARHCFGIEAMGDPSVGGSRMSGPKPSRSPADTAANFRARRSARNLKRVRLPKRSPRNIALRTPTK
jgi:hypothetical protein